MNEEKGKSSTPSGPSNEVAEFEIRISGPGVSVERKVGALTAQRAVMVVMSDGARDSVAIQPSRGVLQGSSDDMGRPSMREFWARLSVDSIPAKITAIGAYGKEQHGKATFGRDDIREGFVDAGEPLPQNLPRDIKKAIRAGYIASSPNGADTFYVTAAVLRIIRGPPTGSGD
jgi:hypothetical protein